MVLLSTLAVSQQVEGMEMLKSILKLGAFLIFWSLLGIYLIPSFLKKVKPFLNDETLLIIALGFCLGMVMIATKAGFSSALGAFVMGSLLAETIEAEKIEKLVKPVKDLFAAIFFVSVGMMIHPNLYLNHIGNRRTSLFRKPWHPFVRTIFEDSPAIRILPDSSR